MYSGYIQDKGVSGGPRGGCCIKGAGQYSRQRQGDPSVNLWGLLDHLETWRTRQVNFNQGIRDKQI